MENPVFELNMFGRNYEQELRPLIRAFYKDAEFIVSHEEADDDEAMMAVSEGLLSTDGGQEYTLNLILMQDWFRMRLLHDGEPVGEASESVVDSERKAFRNRVARALYQILSQETGSTLPWGILTGVRPTKQVYEAFENGISEEEIHRYMKEEYLCSEEKWNVSRTVSTRELELLREMDYRNGYSIYIGIPFCPTTCHYCSFTSYPLGVYGKYANDYLDALEKEMAYAATCFPNRKLSTVYIGGGTPTALNEAQLERLLTMVQTYLPMENCCEYTVEAGRPDSITREKLEIMKRLGVTRISINPQTMQQRTLDLIGRRHTVEQIREAFAMAREVGHDNINMDIIIGLTGETPEDVADTLEEIGKLNPDSLTVHTLAVKRAARLNTEKERYAGLEATGVSEMLQKTVDYAAKENYLPYYLYRQKNMAENLENVGYARKGFEGLYNILIMEEKQTILALGAGATSKYVFYGEDRIERTENVKSLKDYIERIDEMIERKRAFIEANGEDLFGGEAWT